MQNLMENIFVVEIIFRKFFILALHRGAERRNGQIDMKHFSNHKMDTGFGFPVENYLYGDGISSIGRV